MPLQNLVDYFNERFVREHRSSFLPLILGDGKVIGRFGPIRIGSDFESLRKTLRPTMIAGQISQVKVSTHNNQYSYTDDISNLLLKKSIQTTDYETIINYDRLCRSVHLLNYLSLAHLPGGLFLEVDPRLILGLSKDHGIYFEEIIARCGLENKNIIIVLAVDSQYSRHYQELALGLENYRRRGYRLALKFDSLTPKSQAIDLIAKLSPNYAVFSAQGIKQLSNGTKLAKLHYLTALVASVGGRTILEQIENQEADLVAKDNGFDFVAGAYYRAFAVDPGSSPKPIQLEC